VAGYRPRCARAGLEGADQLARHVVIVDHGHLVDAGTPDELK
jgi:hypothetical protein